jgi:hypothetical protein
VDQPTPSAPARTRRGSRRTGFGTVRRLPSGRYQARFTDDRMERRTAPATFATRREAADYLATVRADMVRGLWRAPELGRITVAAYAESLLAVRVDLAPKTASSTGSCCGCGSTPRTGSRRLDGEATAPSIWARWSSVLSPWR